MVEPRSWVHPLPRLSRHGRAKKPMFDEISYNSDHIV